MSVSSVSLRPKYIPKLVIGDVIVAFDPGRTTGVAVVRYMGSLTDFVLMQAAEIDWDGRLNQIAAYVAHADHIVIESFRLYANKAEAQINNDFPSSQVIGCIDTWAYAYMKYDKITEQPASELVRIGILPQHEEFVRGSEHKKDAYKHVQRFLIADYMRRRKAARKTH